MYKKIDATDIVKDETLSTIRKAKLIENMNSCMSANRVFKICRDADIVNNEKYNVVRNLMAYVSEDVRGAVGAGKLKPIDITDEKYKKALKLLSEYSSSVKGDYIVLKDYLEGVSAQARDRATLIKIRVDKYRLNMDNEYVAGFEISGIYSPSGELTGRQISAVVTHDDVNGCCLSVKDLLKTKREFEDEINAVSAKLKRTERLLTPELINDSNSENEKYAAIKKEYDKAKKEYEEFHDKYIKHNRGAFSFINKKKYKERDEQYRTNYLSWVDELENFVKPSNEKKEKIENRILGIKKYLKNLIDKKRLTEAIPVKKKEDIARVVADYEKYYALHGCKTSKYDINIQSTIKKTNEWLGQTIGNPVSLVDFLKGKGLSDKDIQTTFVPLYNKLKRLGIAAAYEKTRDISNPCNKAMFEKYYGFGICELMRECYKGAINTEDRYGSKY